MMIQDQRVAVIDVETTGLSSDNDEIIEIAIIWPEEGIVFQSLVRPSIPIENSEIHGITNAHVADAPTLAELSKEIFSKLEGRIIAGHNVSFDLAFLSPVILDNGYDPAVPSLCTMELYRLAFGEVAKLSVAAEILGIPRFEPAHRASTDARTATHLLNKLLPFLGKLNEPHLGKTATRILRNLMRPWKPKAPWRDPEVEAARLTEDAQQRWAQITSVLAQTLDVNDALDWESLKARPEFNQAPPAEVPEPEPPQFPVALREPRYDDFEFQIAASVGRRLLEFVWPPAKHSRLARQDALFRQCLNAYEEATQKAQLLYEEALVQMEAEYEEALENQRRELNRWTQRLQAFFAEHDTLVRNIEASRLSYQNGQAEGIEAMFNLVFQHARYPGFCPDEWTIRYDADQRHLSVKKRLPIPADLPRVREYKWQKSTQTFKPVEFAKAPVNAAYDEFVVQTLLRTLHEIEESDVLRHVLSAEVTGFVDFVDPATGLETHREVAQVSANLQTFRQFDLAQVDPKECFKGLKGRPKSKIYALNAL